MIGGPVVPRASKLSTTPPPAASGCEATNASAPHRQASSASVSTHDHVVAQRRALGERADRLQQRRDARRVVRSARPGLHRVVVGHQEQPAGRVGAGEDGDDVAHGGHLGRAGAGLPAAHRPLHARVETEVGQGLHQAVDDRVVGGAPGDMGLGGDPLHLGEGPLGAELLRRSVGRGRRRRPQRQHAPGGETEQQHDDEQADETGDRTRGRHAGTLGDDLAHPWEAQAAVHDHPVPERPRRAVHLPCGGVPQSEIPSNPQVNPPKSVRPPA